jgi:presenilin-like A22 family membrane protease
VLIGVLVATAALVATSVLVIRAASHLPASTAPRTVEERATGRWFALVVGAEVAALVVVNPVAAATGHVELMPSLNLMIVGLHFLPLAWIFRVPRYYVMGVLFCGIPAGMMLSISADTLVGHPPAWYVIPSLGCGLVAGLTAMAGLREAWQSVVGLRPVLPTLS